MLHLRRESVSLADLVSAASAIALVRPDDPPQVVEEVRLGGDGPPDRPQPPAVSYLRAFDRFVVEEWVVDPGARPAAIEVASPSNESSAREAHDAANGMLGHVHHVVFEYVLADVPEAWRAMPDGRRIVFLEPTSMDRASIRFSALYGGLSVGPGGLDAVRAALPPAPPPPRRLPVAPIAVAVVILALVIALIVAS